MYKNKDCIGRSSKYHAAWKKDQLLDECEKLGLRCPKNMTKAQICQVLNDGTKSPKKSPIKTTKKATKKKALEKKYGPLVSKKSVCNLPRDVRFQVFDELSIGEVQKLCQTDKECAKTCENEEFWKRRLIRQYNMFEKPDDLSWKEWYKKVFNSGDLKVVKTSDNTMTNLTAERVVKCFPIAKAVFYINLDSELWAMGDFASIPGGRNGYYIRSRVMDPTFNKDQPMLRDVKDIYIGSMTLVLKNDGDLLINNGNEYVFLLKGVQKIFYNPMFKERCLALINLGYLVAIYLKDYNYITRNILGNITTATVSDTGTMFAIDGEGSLLKIYESHQVSTVSQPGYYNLNKPTITRDIFFAKGVKRITAVKEYLFVIDVNDKLWIYKEDRFYPIDYSDLNLQGKDILAGFNQDQYQNFDARSVKPGDTLSIIDTNNNLYLQKINQLEVPLQVFDTSVITATYGSDYIAYVKTRGK